jgi:hypothetical protein
MRPAIPHPAAFIWASLGPELTPDLDRAGAWCNRGLVQIIDSKVEATAVKTAVKSRQTPFKQMTIDGISMVI